MATATLVVTSNTDGTLTVTTTSATAQKYTTYSLKAAMDVAKGWTEQALNQGTS